MINCHDLKKKEIKNDFLRAEFTHFIKCTWGFKSWRIITKTVEKQNKTKNLKFVEALAILNILQAVYILFDFLSNGFLHVQEIHLECLEAQSSLIRESCVENYAKFIQLKIEIL